MPPVSPGLIQLWPLAGLLLKRHHRTFQGFLDRSESIQNRSKIDQVDPNLSKIVTEYELIRIDSDRTNRFCIDLDLLGSNRIDSVSIRIYSDRTGSIMYRSGFIRIESDLFCIDPDRFGFTTEGMSGTNFFSGVNDRTSSYPHCTVETDFKWHWNSHCCHCTTLFKLSWLRWNSSQESRANN